MQNENGKIRPSALNNIRISSSNIFEQHDNSSTDNRFDQMSLDSNTNSSDSNNSKAEVRNINNNEQKGSVNNNGNKNSANNIFVRDKFILEKQPSDYLLFKNFNDTDMKPETRVDEYWFSNLINNRNYKYKWN